MVGVGNQIETDNKEVTGICNGSSQTLDKSILVTTILDTRRRNWHTRIVHIGQERNELADRLVCLGKQQTWQGEVFAVPSGDVAELVIAEQRSWRERSLGAGSNVFRYLRDDPGG
ncbi:hypothetical protein V6N12_021702 [Hibiscus sabdariffa]|uniref:RNase H type-1 domain-containing protein n=1 Tax=Hibiscus sabdariffa TaxID=183260 RepID=A0ABR2FSG1_9ROSI